MRLRLLAALAVVVTTGWWLGTFRLQTYHQAGGHSYAVDFRGAQWIRSQDASPRTYFRTSFNLDKVPESATLWVDAEQTFTAFVNERLADSSVSDARAGRAPRVRAVDLTTRLVAGTNALAFQVTNADDSGLASLRARLTVVIDGKPTDRVSGSTWRATSDITMVKHRAGSGQPSFSEATFDDGSWPLAQVVPAVRDQNIAPAPTITMEQPLVADTIGPPLLGGEMVASTVIDLPAGATDGWLRVVASGTYAIFLDGELLTTRSQPNAAQRGVPLQRVNLLNLGSFFHSGRNVLAVHVSADPLAALYVDGNIDTPLGTVSVGTGSRWGVASVPFGNAINSPPSTLGSSLGPPAAVWPQGMVKSVVGVGNLNVPTGLVISERALSLGALLILWLLLAGAVTLASGVPFARALLADAAGHLPGAAAIAAVEQLPRLADVRPPFPHVPGMVLVLILIIFVGKLASAVVVSGVVKNVLSPVRLSERAAHALRHAFVESPVATWLRRRWSVVVVSVIAGVAGGVAAFRLAYEPLWQDELASLNAARAVRDHLLPQLPSTLYYWKGELYSAVIATVGAFTSDGVVSLRMVSVFWYIATILAFAFLLVPTVMPRRPGLQVGATLLFATAPPELAWSRDVRMYQQAQFFAVVFIALFLQAMRSPRTRTIAASAVALVLMYLSHEETFVFLPAIPVVFLAMMRLRWVRDWRWWVFGGGAALIMGGEYVLATVSHPPVLGYDHSNKPYVIFDPNNFFFYLSQVYFPVRSQGGTLALISTLAVIAGVVGVVRRSVPRLYLTAFLWIPVVALSTVFSPKVSRYVFITFPVLFLLAGIGALDILGALRRVLAPLAPRDTERSALRLIAAVTVIPGFLWLTLSTSGGLRDYGLAVARLTHASTAHKHTDYDYVGRYVIAHQKPGDLLVTLCPPNLAAYYVGRTPDRIIATGRDKLLYLMERNGQVVDTNYGVPVILTAADLRHVLEAHRRIWVVTDQGPYLNGVDPAITQLLLSSFDEVKEGASAAVYFRGE